MALTDGADVVQKGGAPGGDPKPPLGATNILRLRLCPGMFNHASSIDDVMRLGLERFIE